MKIALLGPPSPTQDALQDAFASLPGVDCSQSLVFVRSDLDAVAITPGWHIAQQVQVALDSLEDDCHVLLPLPMAADLSQAQALVNRADALDLLLMAACPLLCATGLPEPSSRYHVLQVTLETSAAPTPSQSHADAPAALSGTGAVPDTTVPLSGTGAPPDAIGVMLKMRRRREPTLGVLSALGSHAVALGWNLLGCPPPEDAWADCQGLAFPTHAPSLHVEAERIPDEGEKIARGTLHFLDRGSQRLDVLVSNDHEGHPQSLVSGDCGRVPLALDVGAYARLAERFVDACTFGSASDWALWAEEGRAVQAMVDALYRSAAESRPVRVVL